MSSPKKEEEDKQALASPQEHNEVEEGNDEVRVSQCIATTSPQRDGTAAARSAHRGQSKRMTNQGFVYQ